MLWPDINCVSRVKSDVVKGMSVLQGVRVVTIAILDNHKRKSSEFNNIIIIVLRCCCTDMQGT